MVDKSNLYLTIKIHLYYALQSIIFFCVQLDRVFTSLIVTHVLKVSSDLTKQASTDADGCSKTVHTPMSTNQNLSSDRQSYHYDVDEWTNF